MKFHIHRLDNRSMIAIDIPDDTAEGERLRVAVVTAAQHGICLDFADFASARLDNLACPHWARFVGARFDGASFVGASFVGALR